MNLILSFPKRSRDYALERCLHCPGGGTKRSIVSGLVVGLVVGLGEALVFGLRVGLSQGLLLGLLGGLITVLVTGFSMSQMDDRVRVTPNQGIWRSARNGLVVGLGFGLLLGLGFGLIYRQPYGLEDGLFFGLFGGLIAMMGFGLGPFFQHFTLRFWLWHANDLPRNMVAFLDEATDLLLLRKVGGGYIFVHRLLLEYFASLDTTATPDGARAKREQG